MIKIAKTSSTKIVSTDIVTAFKDIPYFILSKELKVGMNDTIIKEFTEIKALYKLYEKGSDFVTEGSCGDYVPTKMKYKIARTLIDKQARFMFGEKPDFVVKGDGDEETNDENVKNQILLRQKILDKVLDGNKGCNVSKLLVQAAKDCFIAKRVACLVDMNDIEGIRVHFYKSLQFIYETDYDDPERLLKFVAFTTVRESSDTLEKRYLVKRYELEEGKTEKDSVCYVEEILYDGRGNVVSNITPRKATKFNYVPAVVITNEGLLGNTKGESEIEQLGEMESGYSKLASADMDAERKGMNPIRYTVDMSYESTKGLSSSAGSYWDLQHNQEMDSPTPLVGTLAPAMNHTTAVKTTLERIKNAMYAEVDVPNIDLETMEGIITSGKALKAIYWPLTIRCNEKLKTWVPALKFIMMVIIEGAILYPNVVKGRYIDESLTEIEYDCNVKVNYPLPEDEHEEKEINLQEVDMKTMSRKRYMQKWLLLSEDEANAEIDQIARETNLLDTGGMNQFENNSFDSGESFWGENNNSFDVGDDRYGRNDMNLDTQSRGNEVRQNQGQ